MRTEFQFCKIRRILEMDGDDDCITIYMNVLNTSGLYTHKSGYDSKLYTINIVYFATIKKLINKKFLKKF